MNRKKGTAFIAHGNVFTNKWKCRWFQTWISEWYRSSTKSQNADGKTEEVIYNYQILNNLQAISKKHTLKSPIKKTLTNNINYRFTHLRQIKSVPISSTELHFSHNSKLDNTYPTYKCRRILPQTTTPASNLKRQILYTWAQNRNIKPNHPKS